MFTPKDMPSHKPTEEKPVENPKPESKPSPKKAFVREDHLSQRAFRQSELVKFRAQMESNRKPTNYKIRKK